MKKQERAKTIDINEIQSKFDANRIYMLSLGQSMDARSEIMEYLNDCLESEKQHSCGICLQINSNKIMRLAFMLIQNESNLQLRYSVE